MDADRRDEERGVVHAARAAAHHLTQWPLMISLAVVGVGVVFAWLGYWRRAAFAIGVAMAVAAVLRLVLPAKVAGLLRVRSRWFDVLLTGLMAAGILMLTLIVPPLRR